MAQTDKIYPDNAAIHARKTRGRKARSEISFSEKLSVLDDMKKRVAPIVQARKIRRKAEHP